MKKKILTIALIFISLCNFAKAGSSIELRQNIKIDQASISTLNYSISVQNGNEKDLIQSMDIELPFQSFNIKSISGTDSYSVNGSIINLNFKNNPIDVGMSRTFDISLTANVYEKWGQIKRVTIPQIDVAYDITLFQLGLTYPESWGLPSFISDSKAEVTPGSVILHENTTLSLVWGTDFVFDATYKPEGIEANQLIPFIKPNSRQAIKFSKWDGITKVYFDSNNNTYFWSEIEKPDVSFRIKVIQSPLKQLNIPVRDIDFVTTLGYEVPKFEGATTEEKVQKTADYLKEKFFFSEKKETNVSFDELKGDDWNLQVVAMEYLRANGIPSIMTLGWDFGKDKSNSSAVWIDWFDGENWQQLDIDDYIYNHTKNIKDVNPERVSLIELAEWNIEQIEKLDEIRNFQQFFKFDIEKQELEETQGTQEISVNLLWRVRENTLKNVGVLNINNPTDRVLNLKSLYLEDVLIKDLNKEEHLYEGVLPASHKSFEFNYFLKLKNVFKSQEEKKYDVVYELDAQEYAYTSDTVVRQGLLVRKQDVYFVLGVALILFALFTTNHYLPKEAINKKIKKINIKKIMSKIPRPKSSN